MPISGTKESQAVLLQALEHIRRQTSRQLSSMKKDEKFADVDWNMLNDYLPDKLLEELDEEQNTDICRHLSHQNMQDLLAPTESSFPKPTINTDQNLLMVPINNQSESNSNSPSLRRKSSANENILTMDDATNNGDEHYDNIRKEFIIRFLTARAIDYEKQWHLGMIRRRTLDILIESVEQAKQKYSLKLHWKLIVKHFRLPIVLMILLKLDYFKVINRWRDQLVFNHISRTIELTLSEWFH